MTKPMLCLFVGLLACSPAVAAELEGVEMPDTITVDATQLQLNGMGLREKLWINVYVAGLYLQQKSDNGQEILDSDLVKQLRMHFIYKKVGSKKLTDAWTDGLKANQSERFAELETDLDRLNSWMEDVVRGDEMTFTSVPGAGLRVEVRGAEKGVISDETFSKAFWSIFLGDKPPTGKFKNGLLGG